MNHICTKTWEEGNKEMKTKRTENLQVQGYTTSPSLFSDFNKKNRHLCCCQWKHYLLSHGFCNQAVLSLILVHRLLHIISRRFWTLWLQFPHLKRKDLDNILVEYAGASRFFETDLSRLKSQFCCFLAVWFWAGLPFSHPQNGDHNIYSMLM